MTRIEHIHELVKSHETPAYILAGGMSRRFGSDKARATKHGTPLIVRLSETLRTFGFGVIVVARQAGQYADLGLETIADLIPDQGPIGGLRTALAHRRDGWLLLCSCDLLELHDRWVAALMQELTPRPDVDAIAARDDRWQPFPGLYHTRLTQRADWVSIHSFQQLLDAADVRTLPASDLPPIRQANTKVALDEAQSDDITDQ